MTNQKNKVNKLIFFVTNRCNSRCKHCFYWKNLNQEEVLTFDEIKKIADSLGKLDTLLISGGEPFLRTDLIDVCQYFINQCNLNLLSIPTNGTLKEQTINFVKKMHNQCHLRIYVSIEGLKETHNRIRGIDCFDQAVDLMKSLVDLKKDYHFTPLAMITVSNQNINELAALTKLLNNIGIHYSVTPIRGNPKDNSFRPPTSEEWNKLIDNLSKYRHFYGTKSSFRNNQTNLLRNLHRRISTKSRKKMYCSALNGKRNFICDAGKNTGVLDYDGKVYLCELTSTIGNVKDEHFNFNKVWYNEKAEKMRLNIKKCVCTHACFINSRYNRSVEWIHQLLS